MPLKTPTAAQASAQKIIDLQVQLIGAYHAFALRLCEDQDVQGIYEAVGAARSADATARKLRRRYTSVE